MLKIEVKTVCAGLIVLSTLVLSACGHYPSINVKVVDAETSEPIEGAVLLSQWTITTGFGYKSTHSYKVVEVESDRNGLLEVEGVSKAGVNSPSVTVYKKGYVAWNNERIFPDYKKRRNFQWRDGYTFRLEPYKPEYSHRDHVYFIYSNFSSGVESGGFKEAWRWETLLHDN